MIVVKTFSKLTRLNASPFFLNEESTSGVDRTNTTGEKHSLKKYRGFCTGCSSSMVPRYEMNTSQEDA
jgi:hypothetical protein